MGERHLVIHLHTIASDMSNKELVGTELSKIIPDWAVQFEGECGCKDLATKMDKWGIEGCRQRADDIVAHLVAQDDHLIPVFKVVPKKMKEITARCLLNRAMHNAEKKASLPNGGTEGE